MSLSQDASVDGARTGQAAYPALVLRAFNLERRAQQRCSSFEVLVGFCCGCKRWGRCGVILGEFCTGWGPGGVLLGEFCAGWGLGVRVRCVEWRQVREKIRPACPKWLNLVDFVRAGRVFYRLGAWWGAVGRVFYRLGAR